MRRTGPSYEKPSLISQGLVVCFSIAVVVMAGWFALVILFSHDASTMAADDSRIETAAPLPDAAVVSPESEKPDFAARLSAAYVEPPPRDPPDAAPPRSALPLLPPVEPPAAITFDSRYPAFPPMAAMPNANYRGIPADESFRAESDAADGALEAVPLPKPRRAAIPVPRPRPRLDAEDQPDPDPSFFDLLINRQR